MKMYVSLPYVYPLCPLNFNHAKMFVIADVYARFARSQFTDDRDRCIFPVASHFTGNTAQSTAVALQEYFDGNKTEENEKIFRLYKNFYSVPYQVVKLFVNPDYLMSYFHNEIIWELKSLQVSCDYENAYTTQEEEFSDFVRAIVSHYEKENLLVRNENGDLAVNYDDSIWRQETEGLINETTIKQPFQRKSILSAFNNLSSGWEMLRNSGYGVVYDDTGLIIDPMFDSELFMIYDLFVHWRNYYNAEIDNSRVFFEALFDALKTNELVMANPVEEAVAKGILSSLPCDIFFGEEHLKNWIGKKFFAEQRLLHPSFRTQTYQILGMGSLEKKRMSASRGHAILTRDLIKKYGGTISRMIILLSGGNISKPYNYENNLPEFAQNTLNQFMDYWTFLNSDYPNGESNTNVKDYYELMDKLIDDGYIRKALTELLVNIPAKNKQPDIETKANLIEFYKKYVEIFLPEVRL